MPDYLTEALRARQKRINEQNAWQTAGQSVMGSSVYSPQARLESNLAAALIQGLVGGGMTAYGQQSAEQEYRDTLNKNFTLNPQTQKLVPARPLAEMMADPGSADLAAAVALEERQRADEAIKNPVMRTQIANRFAELTGEKAGVMEQALTGSPLSEARILSELVKAGQVGERAEQRMGLAEERLKFQKEQQNLKNIGLNIAGTLPTEADKKITAALNMGVTLQPMLDIAREAAQRPGGNLGKWFKDQITKRIPTHERSLLGQRLDGLAQAIGVEKHGGRGMSDIDYKVLKTLLAGDEALVTGDLVDRLEYTLDMTLQGGVSAISNAMSQNKYNLSARGAGENLLTQMTPAQRARYAPEIYRNWEPRTYEQGPKYKTSEALTTEPTNSVDRQIQATQNEINKLMKELGR
jgi:hypothetical protein